MQAPITMDDYLASRYIAEPLRLLDYCLINDGGVCLIVTSAERARDLKKPPVYIHSMGMAGDFDHQYTVDDFFYGALQMVGEDLFEGSEITREDIDVAEIYDNFTPTLLFTLEGLGFCKQGESEDWITPERIAPRRRTADKHIGRPHERELHAGLGPPRGGGAPGARRMRRAPGRELPYSALRLRRADLQRHRVPRRYR